MIKHNFCNKFTRTILSLALIICALTNSNLLFNEASIAHAATPVQASFYLVDEAKAWAAYPSIDWTALTYVGSGTINYSTLIMDNASATKKAIVKNPNTAITWTHVAKISNKYYVAARLTDETKKLINNKNSAKPDSNTAIPANSSSPNKAPQKTPAAESSATHILTRSQILSLTSNSYPSTDSVKWEGFKKYAYDVADGVIPMSLINDPVYTSMNLPSETLSEYMISCSRDNAHVYNVTS